MMHELARGRMAGERAVSRTVASVALYPVRRNVLVVRESWVEGKKIRTSQSFICKQCTDVNYVHRRKLASLK
jgi:hypothetical protein